MVSEYEIKKQICEIGKRIYDRGMVASNDGNISVKLNDKFQVQGEAKEQIVQIMPKYDHVCPRCQIEIARRPMTKEEAMEEYDLIEKN